MLLAIDIGNTNVTVGVFDQRDLKATFRLSTDTRKMPDEYALSVNQLLPLRGLSLSDIDAVAIWYSVVPPLTPSFTQLARDYFGVEPLEVGSGTRTGISVRYDSPRDVGADRIVDAAAAFSMYGGPVIVVDVGTATVFDAVSESGDYLWRRDSSGHIHRRRLPLPHHGHAAPCGTRSPARLSIGRNTVHALQAGLVFGYAELVKGMVARFKNELGSHARVVATGGLADVVAAESAVFDAIDPNLTLTGLRIVYELNNDGRHT